MYLFVYFIIDKNRSGVRVKDSAVSAFGFCVLWIGDSPSKDSLCVSEL